MGQREGIGVVYKGFLEPAVGATFYSIVDCVPAFVEAKIRFLLIYRIDRERNQASASRRQVADCGFNSEIRDPKSEIG
jgi:hypothetical protein